MHLEIRIGGFLMDLINRYIYAVIRQLPDSRKKEVEKEIRLLIDELLEEYTQEMIEEEKVRCVLEKLGSPNQLADRYRGKERYLIGPRYFNKYVEVMKVVLLVGFIGITVGGFFTGILHNQDVIPMITSYCATVFEVLLQAAAWVTIIFALFEYNGVSLEKELGWSIKDLPVVPSSKAVISRVGSVITIIISILFFSILYFSPQLVSFSYTTSQGVVNIPAFNSEVLEGYKVLIILVFLITVIQESLKMIWGTWNKKRGILCAGASALSSGAMLLIFASQDIWNSQIEQVIGQYADIGVDMMTKVIVMTIMLVTIIEIGESLYKGFRYNV